MKGMKRVIYNKYKSIVAEMVKNKVLYGTILVTE